MTILNNEYKPRTSDGVHLHIFTFAHLNICTLSHFHILSFLFLYAFNIFFASGPTSNAPMPHS